LNMDIKFYTSPKFYTLPNKFLATPLVSKCTEFTIFRGFVPVPAGGGLTALPHTSSWWGGLAATLPKSFVPSL